MFKSLMYCILRVDSCIRAELKNFNNHFKLYGREYIKNTHYSLKFETRTSAPLCENKDKLVTLPSKLI